MRIADVITLAAALANLFVGLFVIQRNYKKPLNITFALFSLNSGLWAFSNFVFYFFPTKFLLESQYAFGSLELPLAIIWFIVLMRGKIAKTTLGLLIVSSLLLGLTPYAGNLIVKDFHIIQKHDYFLQLSPLFNVYGVVYILFFLYLVIFVLRSYKKSSGIKKLQLRYILAGVTAFGGVSLFVSVILPLFDVSVVAPFDAQSSLLFVGFSMYAIIKHRLLDIRFVISKSIIYGVLLSVVTLIFVFITFLSGQLLSSSSTSKAAVSLFVAILIVFGLDPLKQLLSNLTDRFFFKAKINYQAILRALSETLNFELDQDKLIRELRVTLEQELKLKSVATLLRKNGPNGTECFEALPEILSKKPDMILKNDSSLVRYLRQHRHVAILESLERKIDDAAESERAGLIASKEEFERLDVALVYPIFAQGHLIAILTLGQKLSGDSFSNDDLQLIEVLGPQIGSAIQKANLFEEVKEFSAGLQQKVDAATSELRERNTSLQTLQRITREITRTLDFNQVVQQIADSVATELGYMGAILVFVDNDGKTVRARAISRTTLTAKVIAMLPGAFSNFTSNLDDESDTNLAHQVLRHGEIIMTRSMPQVISPPVPKMLAAEIQKVLHIKTMVVVPINSEGRTIGCIEIGVQRLQEEITKSELDTMQSLADELGVLARNLALFSAIQRTNEQLEEANKHLQALDQAKSEFVSIASHQLRTPMTGIMGYLSMMTEGDFGKLAPEHEKILRELLSESQRMIRLINQFLNVSKIEAGKFSYEKKPVNLAELVQKQVNELRKGAEDKGLKLLYEPPSQALPITMADPDKLEDVILNLIDNAVKYTAKGNVTVKVEATPTELHFSTTDTGIGIKAADAHELFNKFVRGKGIAQIHPDGSGLGLFIAKSIIDAQGGKIWAESAGEGQGSTFRFTIPIIQPSSKL